MSGGYPQQGYQARPPTSWGQPGPPMQQPGYGYAQPGAYPGPSPQYNMNQPSYSGYPPQPTSGGYATGWDQSTAPQNQQTAQGGGYDYYNQQQPPQQQQAHGGPGAPTDGSGYGYGQAPAYSQGQAYGQDGYGGYHAGAAQSGYGQTQPNPASGYDQQQQGYNSTYGNVSNPTPDGHTTSYGTQGEANQAPAPGQSYNAGGQPIIHLKLLVRRVMEYPHLHRVVTEPKHLLVMAVMVHLRLKNHQLLSQCMHSHSSHPALKVVGTLSLGILIPRLQLRKLVMLRQIQAHKDLHHQVIQHLSQGMQPQLMEPHQQLNLAMGNSSLLHTIALTLLDIPNLQRTPLMVLPVVIHVVLMIQLHHLNLHSPVELPKHHLPVDKQSSSVDSVVNSSSILQLSGTVEAIRWNLVLRYTGICMVKFRSG
ncbi:UNVERIFIED_CONTAM: hypothetical protein Slati_1868900 [Sesamum latifolium]|uniref:Uncharacterized protein n=1 Tax=Sesamum latifolium TaxID=2727402 RepID=A0AAW2X1G9_9LAMI